MTKAASKRKGANRPSPQPQPSSVPQPQGNVPELPAGLREDLLHILMGFYLGAIPSVGATVDKIVERFQPRHAPAPEAGAEKLRERLDAALEAEGMSFSEGETDAIFSAVSKLRSAPSVEAKLPDRESAELEAYRQQDIHLWAIINESHAKSTNLLDAVAELATPAQPDREAALREALEKIYHCHLKYLLPENRNALVCPQYTIADYCKMAESALSAAPSGVSPGARKDEEGGEPTLSEAIEATQQALHDLIWVLPTGKYGDEKRKIEDLYASLARIWMQLPDQPPATPPTIQPSVQGKEGGR